MYETIEEEVSTAQDSFYSFQNIPAKFVHEASGVNIDYLLILVKHQNTVCIEKYSINKYYDDVFQKISDLLTQESFTNDDAMILYEIVAKSELLDLSKKIKYEYKVDYFSYCPILSSRYLPDLTIDINIELTNFLEKKKITDDLYTSNSYHEYNKNLTEDKIAENAFSEYLKAIKAISENFGKYVLLWIHAYRFTLAIRECRKNKEVIAHSHKYKGWSLPDYQLTSDLNVKFKTNFGYGYSSYFYTVLTYKNVQIFPFMAWCDYKYAQVSEMINYTELFHN